MNDTLNFFITIEDEVPESPQGNIVEVPATVIVLDENDNAPLFEDVPYRLMVLEDAPVGTTVFSGIKLSDPDSSGSPIEVECVRLPGYEDGCDVFKLETVDSTQSSYKGALVLQRRLNYTLRDSYEMLLNATVSNALKYLHTEARFGNNIYNEIWLGNV